MTQERLGAAETLPEGRSLDTGQPAKPTAACEGVTLERHEALVWYAAQFATHRRPDQEAKVPKTERRVRDCYGVDSYRRAISRACEKTGIAPWHPHQLRHNAATRIRKECGLEAAQVMLGHSRADITEVYAQRDAEKAREVAAKMW